ncbi:MAG: bifunctional phosphopantothenoylcysteine decarboxylase/phosphopantothenate--cysteine ligase CoaBC [Actinomycetota bacterium]
MSPSSPLAGRRVLLGVTGGIAAYKAAHLARLLVAAGADVTVAMTDNATRFIGADTFAALTGNPVHTSLWDEPGRVAHVELAREADLIVVAPATANILAKLALGLADDLLSSTLLEASGRPLILAPAMHTGMWQAPPTQDNVRSLEARGATIVGPAYGSLAAGDEGQGRLAEPEDIVRASEAALGLRGDLDEWRILVTAGPTHEPIDPVRYIGNRSSGLMGIEVAREAAARGAEVTLVLGPGTVAPPAGIRVIPVETSAQMRDAVLAEFDAMDAVVMAAAVADFRPSQAADDKLKKDGGVPDLELVPTTDILAELGERKEAQVLVGFAAETDTGALETTGRQKLEKKKLDLIVVNEVGREGTGFGSSTNDAMLVQRSGDATPLRTWSKRELATAICDRLDALYG